ncbi:NRT2 ribosyltransferase, partial [Pitta sordida]|nr:NRT2 ribosyltransferase [Pitta sordida]
LLGLLLATTLATGTSSRRRDLGSGLREIEFNMAPNSFDDQYRGCRRAMNRRLPGLNRSEFVVNNDYAETWAKATARWYGRGSHAGSQLRPELAVALLAYSMEDGLYKGFNRAIRTAGRSHREYLRHFHFKVVHFLLTEALYELRGAQSHPRCLRVFRGTDGVRFIARRDQVVRFGQFASTSLRRNVSEFYGNETFFEIDTCHGASVRNFSLYPEEDEVLIPPFETFKVTRVTHRGNKTQMWLRAHGAHSNYNCVWLRGDVPGAGDTGTGRGWHRGTGTRWGG